MPNKRHFLLFIAAIFAATTLQKLMQPKPRPAPAEPAAVPASLEYRPVPVTEWRAQLPPMWSREAQSFSF